MADGFVQVPPDSTGKQVDAASLDVGLNTVMRQRMIIGDNSATSEFAIVTGGALLCTGTFNISAMPAVNVNGGVAISGTAVISGNVNISTMPAVVVSGAVSVNGAVNVSTMPATTGLIGLTAGASNIGFINHISATIQVNVSSFPALVAGTANIGAVSIAAGTAKIGFIGKISATATVAGNVNISTFPALVAGTANIGGVSLVAGTANIGFINGISATVTIAGNVILNTAPAYYSASRGPKCVTVSTSVGVALIAAPGAGLCVYVTQLACTNGSGTLTRADVFALSQTASCIAQMFMAASGGGFVMDFDPPVKVLSNSGVTCRIDPNASYAVFNAHFYVAAK